MKLHENKTLFRQAIQFTADQMKIPAVYVEKDYWVTFALFTIHSNAIGKDTVFKGGTALSKCYKLIERFSEDIDLVVLRKDGETDNQLRAKLKTISDVVKTVMPEVNIEGITHKMGMNRKTAHTYNKEFKGSFGQIRDVIIIEATRLGYFEPYSTREIVSYVGQMMIDNRQANLAAENNLTPFDLLVLEPVRTICEKIMSLVRFSYSEDPVDDLKKKIRHAYDLFKLLDQQEFLLFFNSPAFESMLLKVAQDDVASYRNNNQWLSIHPAEALIFRDLDNIWPALRAVYVGDFRNLVYGDFPDQKEILETLQMIRERLKTITWTIKTEA